MAALATAQLPFAEQIEFFSRKKDVLTESYLDVWESEHDVAFMVAGANRADMLADFRAAIDKAISQGTGLAQFRTDFDRIVATYGWDYNGGRNWRSRVIYETNLRQSYNAGRWAQLMQLSKVRPYWQYQHSDAVEHPRPQHLAWHGLVLRFDHPWWRTHFPANGWGCQCYVQALNERDLKRLGKSGPDDAPAVDMQAVLVGQRSPGGPHEVLTPAGVDPGFGYPPGASADTWPSRRGGPLTPPSLTGQVTDALQFVLDKSTRLPASAAAEAAAAALARPRARDALQAGYGRWLDDIATEQSHPTRYLVGALQPSLLPALAQAGARVGTAAVQALADQLPTALPWAMATSVAQIPAAMLDPLAVLLEISTGRLRYVLPGARTERVVVDVALAAEGPHSLSSAAVLRVADLQREIDAGTLQLLTGDL
jgi:hypothetical protein